MDSASNQLLLELAARYQVPGMLDVDPLRSPVTAPLNAYGPTTTPAAAAAAAARLIGGNGGDDSGSEIGAGGIGGGAGSGAPNVSGTISDFSDSAGGDEASTSSAGGDESTATPAGTTTAAGKSKRRGAGATPTTSAFSPATGAGAGATGDRKSDDSAAASTAASGGFTLAGRNVKAAARRKAAAGPNSNSLLVAEIERIQTQLNDRDRTISDLKRDYAREIDDWQSRNKSLDQSLSTLRTQFNVQIAEYDRRVRATAIANQQQTELLKKEFQRLESERAEEARKVSLVKDSLKDLNVSHATYLQYKAVNESKQSVREFAAIRVYEMIDAERKTRERIESELNRLKDGAAKSGEEMDRLRYENESILKKKESREKELLADIQHAESEAKRWHEQFGGATAQIAEMRAKSDLFDHLKQQKAGADTQIEDFRARDLRQAGTLKQLMDERDALSRRAADAEQKVTLYLQENAFLQKEKEVLSTRFAVAEKDRERRVTRIRDLKKANSELVERVLKVQADEKSAFQSKLDAELKGLHEQTAQQMSAIRINQKEAYEREIRSLREARDAAVAELDKLSAKLEQSRATVQQLTDEHRKLQSALENQANEHASYIKLKQFEVERNGLLYEETLANRRKVSLEHEKELKKNEVMRSEYYALKADSEKRIVELEAQIKALSEKLNTYEQLEYELDVAVLSAGRAAAATGKGMRTGGEEEKTAASPAYAEGDTTTGGDDAGTTSHSAGDTKSSPRGDSASALRGLPLEQLDGLPNASASATAGSTSGDAGGSSMAGFGYGSVSAINQVLTQLGSSLPAANRRRLQQSILLAEKLLLKQKELDHATKQAKALRAANRTLKEQLHSAQLLIDGVKQPHSFFISSIQQKEAELKRANEAIAGLRNELASAHASVARQSAIKQKLTSDLAKLMKQRTDLDAMRHLIVSMQQQQAAAAGGNAFHPHTTAGAWAVAQSQHPNPNAAGSQPPLPLESGTPLFHNASLDLHTRSGNHPSVTIPAIPHAQLSFSVRPAATNSAAAAASTISATPARN